MKLIQSSASEPGALVATKATEQMRIKAQARARDFLCYDCVDQRCRNDSFCPAFFTVTEDIAWELIAIAAEMN